MPKAIIVYATRTGETKEIAVHIAKGIRETEVQADIFNITELGIEFDFTGYDAYVFGSSVYDENMLPEMKSLLGKTNEMNLKGCIGGAFGSYEWNDEIPKYILELMKHHLKMDTMEYSLRLKPPLIGQKVEKPRRYGRTIGKKLFNRS